MLLGESREDEKFYSNNLLFSYHISETKVVYYRSDDVMINLIKIIWNYQL